VFKEILPMRGLHGVIRVPGDKSISHRAVMLGALAEGTTHIEGFLTAEDCLHTLQCIRSLGVTVQTEDEQRSKQEQQVGWLISTAQADLAESTEVNGWVENPMPAGMRILIEGKGLGGLQEPEEVLDAGNSGTTLRLLSGILAGQSFTSFLTGDASLCKRPMERITIPLRKMGAQIMGRRGGSWAPLAIRGGKLQAISYQLPVASAQVKSALLLAGLFAPGWTEVSEPALSRNHTELMLEAFGTEVEKEPQGAGMRVRVKGFPTLQAQKVSVPGDLSSAAFLLVAGAIVPAAKLTIKSVGLNPTRDGIIEVLQAMGAKLRITEVQQIAGELRGTIEVESSALQGISVGGEMIPRLIDEIPLVAVAGLFARGVTEIRDAAELKVKESNRLLAICEGLSRLGGRVEELSDGLRIYGGHPLYGASCRSFGDHRIAMALAVAALCAQGTTVLEGAEAVDISFPGFWRLLEELRSGSQCVR